ncbi:M28 family peptidase [Flavobacteriales bacterium]|nr:M28 family peptidase [Flavobacteriales bacterium]
MRHFAIISLCLTVLFSCQEEKKSTQSVKKQTKKPVEVPVFNVDSAYHFIQEQVDFGPRYLSSKGWEQCGDYLVQKLSAYTPHVQEQNSRITTYDGKSHTLRNIIASFSPEKSNRILLCAHWDTRHVADHDDARQNEPILGANDGGSGVGVLIEIARLLSQKESRMGIDIILFDAEDYGDPNSSSPNSATSWCIGSKYWSENPHVPNYYAQYGILLDMVGAKDARFTHEGLSRNYAQRILKKVWKTAHNLGHGEYFAYQMTPQIIDDHYYLNAVANIPTIDIIEHDMNTKSGFNKHWHTHGDDMNNIDKNTLNAVGQTVTSVIYNE